MEKERKLHKKVKHQRNYQEILTQTSSKMVLTPHLLKIGKLKEHASAHGITKNS